MKQKSTFPRKILQRLPIGFQHFKIILNEKFKSPIKPKSICVDNYQTDFCVPVKNNKPISKIIPG